MMQKVFKLNENGKIEFSKKELDALLDEVYKEGYKDGKESHHTWISPYNDWWKYQYPYCSTINTATSSNAGDISVTNNPYTITYTKDTEATKTTTLN
jgi:hypothetical protein